MRKTRANKEREGTEYRGYMKRVGDLWMVRSRIKMYSNHACYLLVVIHINQTSFNFTGQLLWRPAGNHWRKTGESDQDIRSWDWNLCLPHEHHSSDLDDPELLHHSLIKSNCNQVQISAAEATSYWCQATHLKKY